MNNRPISQKANIAVQDFETGVLDYNLKANHPISAKPLKRIRVCLRCQANLTQKHKCANCGLRFHDAPFLSWLKRMWRISPQ